MFILQLKSTIYCQDEINQMCLIANISHLSFDQNQKSGTQTWSYLFFPTKNHLLWYLWINLKLKLSGHLFYNELFGIPIFTDTVPNFPGISWIIPCLKVSKINECPLPSDAFYSGKTWEGKLIATPLLTPLYDYG